MGATSMLLFNQVVGQASASELANLCALSDSADLSQRRRFSQSSDADLDKALIAELKHILEIIPVNPGFQYIEERRPNSAAMELTVVPGTKGTVLIGINLVKALMKEENGGAAVAGVCAHECGHIYQYFSEIWRELSGDDTIIKELHADLIAGYYMGRRKTWTADRVKLFSRALLGLGGNVQFGDPTPIPSSHGTSDQRNRAMTKGYALANKGMSFNQAAASGVEYVREIIAVPSEN